MSNREPSAIYVPPRILVVDDEPPIRDILKFQLENAGFLVSCAEDGEQGLRMAEADPPDIVLLDLMIPHMDGYEVCRRLKSMYGTRHIPVIILTARGELDEKLRGLENGANDYVTKPFSMPELLMRVRNVLNWSQSQREANPLTGLPGNVSSRATSSRSSTPTSTTSKASTTTTATPRATKRSSARRASSRTPWPSSGTTTTSSGTSAATTSW
jgi:DNA-binding response OmpR family regulator